MALIPALILINGFALGKIYKRFNLSLSSYFCLTIGIVTFFGIFGLIMIPLLLFTITFEAILFIYLGAQIVLVVLYIINWRWMFITYQINWKSLIIYGLILTFFILGYFVSRQFNNINDSWIIKGNLTYLERFSRPTALKMNIFVFGENYFKNEFINIFYGIFVYAFKIVAVNDINLLNTFINLFIYTLLGSLITMSVFVKNNFILSAKNLIFICIISLFISLVGYIFSEFFWVTIFGLFIINILSLKQNELKSNVSIYIINLSVVCGVIFDINFLVVSLIINLMATLITYQLKRENATELNILMLFTTLIYLAMSFSNQFYLGFIFLIIIIVIYSFYLFYKSSNIASRVNYHIDTFMYKYVNYFIVVIIVATLAVSIILFLSNSNFTIKINSWILTTIGNPGIIIEHNSLSYYLSNITFWLMNIGILLIALWNSRIFSMRKFLKFNAKKPIEGNQLDLTILIVLFFWNPINTNLYDVITNANIIGFTIDFQVIFFAMFLPVFSVFSKQLFQPKISYFNYGYVGIILTTSTMLLCALNL